MVLNYTKDIKIKYDADVFVAGGGPAGVAAAVSAAENGASVFLAESFGAFGGAGVHALVPAFMKFTDGETFLAGNIARRVCDYINNKAPDDYKEHCPNSIPVEVLKLCYDEMITESGINFAFFTQVSDVLTENNKVKYVICTAKGEIFAVKAKIFIDCTGDGDLATLSGAEFRKGDEEGEMMAATLCALWNGIDWENVKRPDSRCLDEAFADKVFTNEDRHLPGMWQISSTLGGSNAGHIYDIDGTKYDSLTASIIKGRKQLLEYRKYYREYLSGYENAELISSASYMGIRETRRITGDYILNVEDFLARRTFPDEIGRYCYPVDIHSGKNTSAGYEEYAKKFYGLRYKNGESYGIPYRSLTVKGFDNLLTAGRCISTDRSMQSSVRVMPCCFITGQAAGTAAALAITCDGNVRNIDIKELQKILTENGAVIRS